MSSSEVIGRDMTAFLSATDQNEPQKTTGSDAPKAVVQAQNNANAETAPCDDAPEKRETFIPVTITALVDRLIDQQAWPPGQARHAHRFFRYLEYWRRQNYTARMLELQPTYEPFSPDTDLLITRKYSDDELEEMQARVIEEMRVLLRQANYTEVRPEDVGIVLTKESHYGLDLHVDLGAFDECLLFYRGATTRSDTRRNWRKFMRREEFEIPIFQRMFILFKLKPFEERVREIMIKEKLNRREAEKILRKLRSLLPKEVSEDRIYMKLFKNIPRSDLEMCFPNTQVRFRLFDKLKLGVTAGGGLSVGAVGAAGKLALVASNPVAAAGAVAGLGAVAFRQFMSFTNQKQRYMVIMAQNLYFHSMADNRSAMVMLAERAGEEDVKEEMLLYSVLAKETATRADLPAIDAAIEHYLFNEFGITVDFDLEDALERLIEDGIVRENSDGRLETLPPDKASLHLDSKWDVFLDNLADVVDEEGEEFEGEPAA